MPKTTFQQRMKVAIRRAGSQSELARMVNEKYGTSLKPQNIQYLADEKLEKPARGSRHTPHIAGVVALNAQWLASESGPRDAVPINGKPATPPLSVARPVAVKIKETGKVEKVELTSDVLRVAKLLMKLDIDDREEVLAKVEALEIKRRAMRGKGAVPDAKLHHLARQDTEEGRALAAKG